VLGPLGDAVYTPRDLACIGGPEFSSGRETPIGQGKVNFPRFIGRLKEIGYTAPSPSSARYPAPAA